MATVKWKAEEELILSLSPAEGTMIATAGGQCSGCSSAYSKGDWVFRNPLSGNLLGYNCCGSQYVAPALSVASFPVDEAELEVPMSQVMPHGKSRADMCPSCFQIPASSGVCGC